MIDQLAGVLLTLLGEVEIEHSGFELSMAHVALDDAQVDTGFEEMGGIGMAQGVNGDAFFTYPCIKPRTAESALDTTFGHRIEGILCACSASAESWEEKLG